MTDCNDDLMLALRLADVADALTLAGLGETPLWTHKQDGTPVSDVDRAVEEALAEEIASLRPGDFILGEEATHKQPKDEVVEGKMRQWIIDPIDQTRHYLRGNPEFGTLIALKVDNQVNLGVVSAPALGHRWWAACGQGAWKDGRRVVVSRVGCLDEAYLAIAGHREWHTEWDWRRLVQLLGRCTYPTGCSGGFLQQMLVAEGAIDVFIEPWGELWDHAGPSIIVEEAGGKVTTLTGNLPQGGSLLASNGILHPDVLQYLVPKRIA